MIQLQINVIVLFLGSLEIQEVLTTTLAANNELGSDDKLEAIVFLIPHGKNVSDDNTIKKKIQAREIENTDESCGEITKNSLECQLMELDLWKYLENQKYSDKPCRCVDVHEICLTDCQRSKYCQICASKSRCDLICVTACSTVLPCIYKIYKSKYP